MGIDQGFVIASPSLLIYTRFLIMVFSCAVLESTKQKWIEEVSFDFGIAKLICRVPKMQKFG